MNYQNRSSEYSANSFISVQNLLSSLILCVISRLMRWAWLSAGPGLAVAQEKDEILQKVIDQRRVEMAVGKLSRTVEIC